MRSSRPLARPLGPAILRVAGWPIETLAPLRSAGLAARVDAWIAQDEAIADRNGALAARIHACVPGLADPAVRRAALALKRHLHAGTQPPPDTLVAPLRTILGRVLDEAAQSWRAHAGERAAIEAAYAAECVRADAALVRATEDERFRRALCFASPTAFRQCRRAGEAEMSPRSSRRLQATLHRYLMRAVGRATPSGLWAGIALEDVESEIAASPDPIAIAPAPCIVRVSPDLGLFAPTLDAASLSRLDEIRFRINPVLRDAGDGTWSFGVFAEGVWEERRIDDHAALRALRDQFGPGERFSLEQIGAALRVQEPALPAGTVREIAAFWLRHGLLWSSIAFPAHYADPWQGLDAIVASLPPCERPPWESCRASLRRQAEAIEANVEDWPAERLRACLDAAREAVAALLGRYGLTLPEGRDVLVLDRTAPVRFTVSDALMEAVTERLRACWAFDRYGLGEIETQIGIRETFGALARDEPVGLGAVLRFPESAPPAQGPATWEERVLSRAAGPETRAARAAFARWEAEIGPRFAARAHRLGLRADQPGQEPLPPGSALLLVGRGADGPAFRIGGLTPEPSFFHARFAPLFRRDAGAPDAFLSWLAAGLRAVEKRWPALGACDLAIRNQRNPNVTARPRLSDRLLDPLDDGGRFLRDATIARGALGRPILTTAGGGEAGLLLPAARCAAALGGLDRCAALLSAVSESLGRPPLLAPMPRLSREVAEWHHLPRLLLGDTTVGPERWTPPDDLGRSLAEAQGAELFVRWRRFVRRAGLPDFVYTFQGRHRTETLLATDSVLGVACLALDLKAHGPELRLQEVFPRPEESVVRDAAGRHYLAELAVAWHADAAFWERYVAAAPGVAGANEPEAGRRPESVS